MNLSKEILCNIFIFLPEEKYISTGPQGLASPSFRALAKKKRKRKTVKITRYFIVSKLWFEASKLSKCKLCNGKNDYVKKKCMKCGHILEGYDIKEKRRKKYKL